MLQKICVSNIQSSEKVRTPYWIPWFSVSGDYKQISGAWKVFKFGNKASTKMNNITWHITPCHYLIAKNKAKMGKAMCDKVRTPYDSVPSRSNFSSNNSEVIIFCMTLSVSHIVLEDFWPILRFVGICSYTALTTRPKKVIVKIVHRPSVVQP